MRAIVLVLIAAASSGVILAQAPATRARTAASSAVPRAADGKRDTLLGALGMTTGVILTT